MPLIFQMLYLTIMAGIVVIGTHAICRSPCGCIERPLLEALVWGGCLVISGSVNYFLIAHGPDFMIATC